MMAPCLEGFYHVPTNLILACWMQGVFVLSLGGQFGKKLMGWLPVSSLYMTNVLYAMAVLINSHGDEEEYPLQANPECSIENQLRAVRIFPGRFVHLPRGNTDFESIRVVDAS